MLLRKFRYNAIYVNDVGLSGKSDESVFSFAWKTKRIILTHDPDFLDDRKFPFYRNPGVVVMPGGDGGEGFTDAMVDVIRILAPYAKAHAGGKIEITEDRSNKRGQARINFRGIRV